MMAIVASHTPGSPPMRATPFTHRPPPTPFPRPLRQVLVAIISAANPGSILPEPRPRCLRPAPGGWPGRGETVAGAMLREGDQASRPSVFPWLRTWTVGDSRSAGRSGMSSPHPGCAQVGPAVVRATGLGSPGHCVTLGIVFP